MSHLFRRLMIILACVIGLAPLGAGVAPKTEYYKGKVVPLADLVAKAGSHLDADAAPHWLALASDDGKIYPLVKDSGSRLFFNDPELLKRPMRLTGRLLPGSQLLRVTAVHAYVQGKLNDVYYWCDICSIRRSEKNLCECCGGPMRLVLEPLAQTTP